MIRASAVSQWGGAFTASNSFKPGVLSFLRRSRRCLPLHWRCLPSHSKSYQLLIVKEDVPQSGLKQCLSAPPLNRATWWQGPSHKGGCLWRSKVVEEVPGSLESIFSFKFILTFVFKTPIIWLYVKGQRKSVQWDFYCAGALVQGDSTHIFLPVSFMRFYFVRSNLTLSLPAPSPQPAKALPPIQWHLSKTPKQVQKVTFRLGIKGIGFLSQTSWLFSRMLSEINVFDC